MFIKILTKTYNGEKRYYASLVENKRVDGKVVQTVKANLGSVMEELAFSMINRKGLTLKLELRGYMKISHPGTKISKPGYLKQRTKLS